VEPEQFLEIKKQIKIVTASLAVTAITYLLLIPYIFALLQDDFCHLDEPHSSLTTNLMLILISVVQITPCLAIPYAFYYVPSVEREETRYHYQPIAAHYWRKIS
jgi:hypothetical protein